jgi:hypothetical protein
MAALLGCEEISLRELAEQLIRVLSRVQGVSQPPEHQHGLRQPSQLIAPNLPLSPARPTTPPRMERPRHRSAVGMLSPKLGDPPPLLLGIGVHGLLDDTDQVIELATRLPAKPARAQMPGLSSHRCRVDQNQRVDRTWGAKSAKLSDRAAHIVSHEDRLPTRESIHQGVDQIDLLQKREPPPRTRKRAAESREVHPQASEVRRQPTHQRGPHGGMPVTTMDEKQAVLAPGVSGSPRSRFGNRQAAIPEAEPMVLGLRDVAKFHEMLAPREKSPSSSRPLPHSSARLSESTCKRDTARQHAAPQRPGPSALTGPERLQDPEIARVPL